MLSQYRYGDEGDHVVQLQRALMQADYPLPKYGADGVLGKETWSQVEAFSMIDELPTARPIPDHIVSAILVDGSSLCTRSRKPQGYVRVDGRRSRVKRIRDLREVNGIVLHQTGIWMSDTPQRFERIAAHVGILRDHDTPIVHVHPLDAYLFHANSLNRTTIGIEINGHFPGEVRRYDRAKHTGVLPTERQIFHAREAIKWIVQEVGLAGGLIERIYPHRVASSTRRSDPGEGAWRNIGLWAVNQLGLRQPAPGETFGSGLALPGSWTNGDPQYRRFGY